MYQQQLLTHYDFLQLTCENQQGIAPFSFDIPLAVPNSDSTVKKQHTLHVSVLDTGIIEFTPAVQNSSKNSVCDTEYAIVISCGVHGNETAPIEISNHLIGQLLQGKIHLQHPVLFIIANPYAINQQKRFVDENLNSLFSMTKEQVSSVNELTNIESVRATQIEHIMINFYQRYQVDCTNNNLMNVYQNSQHEPFRTKDKHHKPHCLHYDLHTAIRASVHEKFAIVPYLHEAPWYSQQLTLLDACRVNTVLFSNAPTPTLSYFASQVCQAVSLTIELGQVNEFGCNDIETFNDVTDALEKLMSSSSIEIDTEALSHVANSFNFYAMHQRIIKKSNELTFNFSEDSKNFTSFSSGDLLARDGEIEYYSHFDNEAILFPNRNVPINQRALLTVKPITLNLNNDNLS